MSQTGAYQHIFSLFLVSEDECLPLFALLLSFISLVRFVNNLYVGEVPGLIMVGDALRSEENELSETEPTLIEDEEETPTCCNIILIFGVGLGLGLTILVLSLGFIGLGLFVLIPIEQWAEGYDIIIQIFVELPMILILILVLPTIFYIVGTINRFGVQLVSKKRLPRNRKWTVLSGLIVYTLGWILISQIFGFTMNIEHPESYWLGIGSLAITNAIEWLCLLVVGAIGYLVAIKLPLFQDKT